MRGCGCFGSDGARNGPFTVTDFQKNCVNRLKMSIKDDVRLVWLAECVQRCLEVTSKGSILARFSGFCVFFIFDFSTSSTEFEELYKTQADPIQEFVDKAEIGTALLFYTTVEMVQPAAPPASVARAPSIAAPPVAAEPAESQNGDSASSEEKTDSNGAENGASSDETGGDASSSENNADGSSEAPTSPTASATPSASSSSSALLASASVGSLEPIPVKRVHLAPHHLPEAEKSAVQAQRSMYLIKCVDKNIIQRGEESVDDMMARSVEYGVMPGSSLQMLERVIKHVFLPIFEPEQVGFLRFPLLNPISCFLVLSKC